MKINHSKCKKHFWIIAKFLEKKSPKKVILKERLSFNYNVNQIIKKSVLN